MKRTKRGNSIILLILLALLTYTVLADYSVLPENSTNETTNYAPIIETYAPENNPSINVNETQEFTITVSDPENDILSIQWYVDNLPRADQIQETFSYAAIEPGSFEIKVLVTDNKDYTTKKWILTVPEEITEPEIIENITEPVNETQEIINETEEITEPTENITEPEIIKENITEITTEDDTLIQLPAEINKPVRWIRKIKNKNLEQKISIKLPKQATNIKAQKITKLITEEIKEDIKPEKLLLNGKRPSTSLTPTGMTVLEIRKDSWIIRFFKNMFRIFGFATIEPLAEQELVIEEAAAKYEISYETPAPLTEETELENGKKVRIYSDYHYENILTYTTIRETDKDVKLYWQTNGTNILHEAELIDMNDNGLTDTVQWVTKHLSEQTFFINITDTTGYDYLNGTLNRTEWNPSIKAITLSSNDTEQELPSDQEDETLYDIFGGVNMTGNVLLLHLNNDSSYGENDTYAYDFSGNGNNGSLYNGTIPVASGKLNGAFEFDGMDDYVSMTSGGMINYSGGYTIHTFTSNDTFTSSFSGDVEVLVVAGGGASGGRSSWSSGQVGGGGGAGGYRTGNITVVAGDNITVTVGVGGVGTSGAGGNGSDSMFSSITSTGGGGGGAFGGDDTGMDGGSGGGAGGHTLLGAFLGGHGVVGQGYDGGNVSGGDRYSGSGGGSSGPGHNANADGATYANSGPGTANDFSGSNITYATGGSSGYDNNAGGANTGDGGNILNTAQDAPGSSGGSGIVIVRYLTNSSSSSLWIKPASTNVWEHAAYDGSTYYKNGVVGNPTSYPLIGFIIGIDESGSYFNGIIDEVNVWNRSLSADEILEIYNRQKGEYISKGVYTSNVFDVGSTSSWKNISWASNGIGELPGEQEVETEFMNGNANMTSNVLLMHLNDESSYGENGTHIYDFSGNQHNGTFYNNVTRGVGSDTGPSGANETGMLLGDLNGSYAFDGDGDYIDTIDYFGADGITGTNPRTFTAWVKQSKGGASPSIQTILSYGTWDANQAMVWTIENGHILALRTNGGTMFYDATNFTEGNWHHVALVIPDSATTDDALFYLDGLNLTSESFISGANPTSAIDTGTAKSLRIGTAINFPSLYNFNGTIDEVAIWNRSLSDDEILDIYKRGALKLNVSVRGCDDSACSGEDWNLSFTNPSYNDISSLADSQYFQYQFWFEDTGNSNVTYTPELYNVTIGYRENALLDCSQGCLYIRNSTGDNVSIFDYSGNLFLAGSFLTTIGAPDGSDFILKDSSGTNIAWVNDVNGTMSVAGTKTDEQDSYCTSPPANSFIIKDKSGNCVSYIDSGGNLWLRGGLAENENLNP